MLESTEPALHEFGGAHHACPDKARAGREPARTVTRRSRSAWIFHLSPKRGAQHCLGVQGLDLLSIGSEQLIQRFHCSAPATIQCNAGAAASSRPLGTASPRTACSTFAACCRHDCSRLASAGASAALGDHRGGRARRSALHQRPADRNRRGPPAAPGGPAPAPGLAPPPRPPAGAPRVLELSSEPGGILRLLPLLAFHSF